MLRRSNTFLIAAVVITALSRSTLGYAEDVDVPIKLQAQFLAKVAAYDRNMAARAGNLVRIALVIKDGDADSISAARAMKKALGDVPDIGGIQHEEKIVSYHGSAALAQTIKNDKFAIVYISPGFASDMPSIGEALEGGDVLSVSAIGDYVSKGAVLGFGVADGKPKILVHLSQARKQNVALQSDALKLMQILR